ncbi:hypothetical protein [uncultured Bartonella sp.]|uniref:hypothetical protein n=1 Tax=uncultured Bartonella sp. TaxID=104108 RepID=UPI0026005AEE|nr:hypothetical protein [uncultured Bartonella sp.]
MPESLFCIGEHKFKGFLLVDKKEPFVFQTVLSLTQLLSGILRALKAQAPTLLLRTEDKVKTRRPN